VRAVARERARPVAGQARVRPERLCGYPVSHDHRRSHLRRLLTSFSIRHSALTRITLAITGASGAIYATRTMAALLERGCHLELVVSDYGRRLLRDELGETAAVEKLADYL